MTFPDPEVVRRLARSPAFDADWYRRAYPDVVASGLEPAEHYLWLGARLGRSPLPPARAAAEPTDRSAATVLDALFVDGTNGSASTQYRVHRIAAGLAAQGWSVRTIQPDEAGALDERLAPRFVIIHRAPFTDPFPAFVAAMRARGAIIVYDIDDLLFDEELITEIDAVRHMTAAQQRHFRSVVRSCLDFILAADCCTTSTVPLVRAIEELGKPAWRVRNSLSADNLERFAEPPRRPARRPSPFTIGYYSGTKTHQADFAPLAPALARVMATHDDVQFRLVGALDLQSFPELASFERPRRPGASARITRVGLMPHDTMIRDQLACDLIVAPLHSGDPFCEAKSELKFFEAALTGCPVIASPTLPFREASEEGRLALLANTTEEWLAALTTVHDDYDAALERASRAYRHVHHHYSEQAAASEAAAAYRSFVRWRGDRARWRAGPDA